MAPGLSNMPEVVMSKIMEDVDIKAMFILRRVCHDLKNFIDDVKPNLNLDQIIVHSGFNSIISIDYLFSGGNYEIEYEKQIGGCSVGESNKENQMMFENEDFVTVFIKDFKTVLGHQKSVLKKFTLMRQNEDDVDGILWENVQRILKARAHPLKVEKFTAARMDQKQLMLILPLLDSKTLNRLKLKKCGSNLETDQLAKLDQWKNIKFLYLDCDVDYGYIQHFTHFKMDYIRFKANNFPDLVSLKDIFLQSTGFENVIVSPTNYDDNDARQSIEALGGKLLFDNERVKYRWYYRFPATTEVLEMRIYMNYLSNMIIKLSRIEESKVPRTAMIQN